MDAVAENQVEEQRDVVITLDGEDIRIPQVSLNIDMDSSNGAIIDAVREIVRENRGVDLMDEGGDVAFAVRKAVNSNTIYVYPKPVAG